MRSLLRPVTNRRPHVLPALLAVLLLACGRTGGGTPALAPAEPPASARPPSRPTLTARDPVGAGVLAAMDPTVDPCADFYRHACGGWLASTPHPPDKPKYGRGFDELAERNTHVLRGILEAAARGDSRRPDDVKLGAFWRACTDVAAHDRAGVAPLAPQLAAIRAVRDAASMLEVVGQVHGSFFSGIGPLFTIFVQADARDPDVYVATVTQGGLGLPDREFYLQPEHAATRAAYEEHIAHMLGFLGEAPAAARKQAAAIVGFETALAGISLPLVEMLDPSTTYNRLGVPGLQALDRALPWSRYFAALGYPRVGPSLVVTAPAYFSRLGPLLRATEAATLRAYLRWQVLHVTAPLLSRDIVAADFAFSRTLTGADALSPQWERCVEFANFGMGELLGRAFVEQNFAGSSKAIATAMIGHIERAFAAGLASLAWMDPVTRARAAEKVRTLTNMVGHPDPWRDHDALHISPNEHLRNVVAMHRFMFTRDFDRVGEPVDRREWRMPPGVVNASYDRTNTMVFPAAALQPPFFSAEFPMAMNFGGIGLAMGHELTHGFDNRGRKYDAHGVLREWWDPAAVERFEARTRCVERAYGAVEVLPGLKLDGALTLSENIADLGGLKAAHAGYQDWQRDHHEDPRIDGLSNDQLFFLGFAQLWCTHITDEALRLHVATDVHSPPRQRVNVTLAHLPAFWDAWQCGPGTPMHAEAACEVW